MILLQEALAAGLLFEAFGWLLVCLVLPASYLIFYWKLTKKKKAELADITSGEKIVIIIKASCFSLLSVLLIIVVVFFLVAVVWNPVLD